MGSVRIVMMAEGAYVMASMTGAVAVAVMSVAPASAPASLIA